MVKIEFTPLSLDRKIFPFKKGFKKLDLRVRCNVVDYGGRGGYFFKNLKVSKVASSALAEGATFEHFFQKKVAFSAVAEEATFFYSLFGHGRGGYFFEKHFFEN